MAPAGGPGSAGAISCGECAGAAHPAAELGVVEAAVAALADQREDMGGAHGEVRFEPGRHQVLDLVGQPHQHEAGADRPGLGRGRQDRLDLVVGQAPG